MKKIIVWEFWLLLAGTLFAWGNFGVELNRWLQSGSAVSCVSGEATTNPFLTPCFYGAIFFTLAFILSAILLSKVRKEGFL